MSYRKILVDLAKKAEQQACKDSMKAQQEANSAYEVHQAVQKLAVDPLKAELPGGNSPELQQIISEYEKVRLEYLAQATTPFNAEGLRNRRDALFNARIVAMSIEEDGSFCKTEFSGTLKLCWVTEDSFEFEHIPPEERQPGQRTFYTLRLNENGQLLSILRCQNQDSERKRVYTEELVGSNLDGNSVEFTYSVRSS